MGWGVVASYKDHKDTRVIHICTNNLLDVSGMNFPTAVAFRNQSLCSEILQLPQVIANI